MATVFQLAFSSHRHYFVGLVTDLQCESLYMVTWVGTSLAIVCVPFVLPQMGSSWNTCFLVWAVYQFVVLVSALHHVLQWPSPKWQKKKTGICLGKCGIRKLQFISVEKKRIFCAQMNKTCSSTHILGDMIEVLSQEMGNRLGLTAEWGSTWRIHALLPIILHSILHGSIALHTCRSHPQKCHVKCWNEARTTRVEQTWILSHALVPLTWVTLTLVLVTLQSRFCKFLHYARQFADFIEGSNFYLIQLARATILWQLFDVHRLVLFFCAVKYSKSVQISNRRRKNCFKLKWLSSLKSANCRGCSVVTRVTFLVPCHKI